MQPNLVQIQDSVVRPTSLANSPLHILVVDDARSQRLIAAGHLKRWGYHVTQAASGIEALRICANEHVDMVLSDWIMPEMNGLDFCEAFRKLERNSYGYFILLTSKNDSNDIAAGLDIGADDFLSKPLNPIELKARIKAGQRVVEMERKLVEQRNEKAAAYDTIKTLYDEIEKDLIEAEKLQSSLVPERHRKLMNGEASLLLQSSHKVGGDLVGFFSFANDRVGLYSIDVSGHGVSSALMTARLAGYLSGSTKTGNLAFERMDDGSYQHRTPDKLARLLNNRLLDEIETDLYFTMVFADVCLRTGKVNFVQAGHPHPVILDVTGQINHVGDGGPPIGLIQDVVFETAEVQLKAGDRLILYSDGITECEDSIGNQFEDGPFEIFLKQHADQSGPAILNDLLWELTAFAGPKGLNDDASAIVFDFFGTK